MGQQQQASHVYVRDDAFGLAALGLVDGTPPMGAGGTGTSGVLSSSAEVYKPTSAQPATGNNSKLGGGDDDDDSDDDRDDDADNGGSAALIGSEGLDEGEADSHDDESALSATDASLALASSSSQRSTAALVPGKWNKTRVVHTQGSYLWLHEDEQSASLADMEVKQASHDCLLCVLLHQSVLYSRTS